MSVKVTTVNVDSAANWESALVNNAGFFLKEEIVWYAEQSPEYSGEPTPAQTEAARRFVSKWLNDENQGFIIPSSEWGKSLYHWLNILVAREASDEELT